MLKIGKEVLLVWKIRYNRYHFITLLDLLSKRG